MADADIETAPADENDDNWLYGDSNNDQTETEAPSVNDKDQQQTNASDGVADGDDKENEEAEGNEVTNDDSHFNDEHFGEVERGDQEQTNGDADSQDNGDSDSDDSDDVKVTIGEIKSGPQAYASLNIKRGVGLVAPGGEKPRPVPAASSKVTLEDLDGPGSINGVPALEFNIDTIEDKPWNKPGADISDYFNYGFNEVTWSAYCERQRRMRVNEAGVALHAGPPPRAPPADARRAAGPQRHDEMPPGMQNNYQSRENTIQVMTAERREYGRAHGRDAPPPADYFSAPPPDHYYPPHAPYEEPWAHPDQSGWAPTEIKELTPGPMGPPAMGPPMGMTPPLVPPHNMPPSHVLGAPFAPQYRSHLPPHMHERDRDRERERDRDRDRDRDRLRERDDRDRRERDRRDEEERDRERDRERSRSIKPERTRDKSYRRERSRSRSRRHKSRSRSPRTRDRSRDRDRDRSRDKDRERSRDRERSIKPKNKEPKEKDDDK
ncbi:unnamed protein product [Euphydryas editha]|uniref:Pre-mRNA polyadenylation factor Fip1 domain-containing protein n=1 Tax=Euphydryas editha TaxID=104508 RepID=A0AAU9UJ06_EUPED|nr:unnamed protein product [Euphydryas editha]